jgi:hypothetical protein
MTSALLLLLMMLCAAGRTPIGQAMRRALVNRPAAWLSRFSLTQVLLLGASMLFGVLLFWLMEEEGLRLFAMYLPELMGIVSSVEIATTVELLGVTLATATMVRVRAMLGWVQAKLPGRSRRAVRQRRPQDGNAANDDDRPAPVRALAA